MIDTSFKSLKIGDKIYILKHGDGLAFHECVVVTTKNEMSMPAETIQGIFSPVTITAKSDTGDFNLPRLDGIKDLYEIEKDGVINVIATTKDKINDYVKRVYNEAKMHIGNMDKYKKTVEDGDKVLIALSNNPMEAGEARMASMESEISMLKSGIEQLLSRIPAPSTPAEQTTNNREIKP